MRLKARIMDEAQMKRALLRMSHEIIERNRGEKVCLVGIYRRGIPLAHELADMIKSVTDETVPVGVLDITLYRDDLSLVSDHPQIKSTSIPFAIEGANVIIVDDVLHTGRTARAAINAICETGRPKTVQFAVMIDRGGHELPIAADYIGKNVPTSRGELISVNVKEYDKTYSVEIYDLTV